MTRKILMTSALVLLNVFSAQAQTPAGESTESVNTIDWKTGVWGDLSQHIGTYDYATVLSDKRIAGALEAQLTPAQREALYTNLTVKAPIGFEDDCLLLSGNARSAGGQEGAFIAICLYKGAVHTALEQNAGITLFTTAEKYDYLPQALKLWIYSQKHQEALGLPDGVNVVMPQP